MAEGWEKVVKDTIKENEEKFHKISLEIWENPENAFHETRAHKILTNFFENEGFKVERKYLYQTGFKAVYSGESSDSNDKGKTSNSAHVAFFCEYDAVPEMGHASGHNLSAESSVAAATAIKKCIQKGVLKGSVTVFGCPGEDSGMGSKVTLVKAGAFSDIDVAMALNPFSENIVLPNYHAMVCINVTYKGKSAHASASPWEGKNALDAAVACYSNIALLRQSLKPTWNVNGVITKGGVRPNSVPSTSELKFWLRAPDHRDLVFLQQKCTACFVAAGKATGCEADFEFEHFPYYPVKKCVKLGAIYEKFAKSLGMTFDEIPPLQHIGSHDIGNVSEIIPCLYPAFDIDTTSSKHSMVFHDDAGKDGAHERALVSAEVLALTAGEVLGNEELFKEIKEEFLESKREDHPRISLSEPVDL